VNLLIAGGAEDPTIEMLVAAARNAELPYTPALTSSTASPTIAWDLEADELSIAGKLIRPTAAFLLPDVFSQLVSPTAATAERTMAWSTTLAGWALAHPEVRVINRKALTTTANKLDVLVRARRCGLQVPETLVTNDPALIVALRDSRIAKPLHGGPLPLATKPRDLVGPDGALGAPTILQEKLTSPETRVYLVGSNITAFRLRSSVLYARASAPVNIEHWESFEEDAAHVAMACRKLARELEFDLAAVDFKTDPATGELAFLDITSRPILSRFDFECGGQIARQLLDWLFGRNYAAPVSPMAGGGLAHGLKQLAS
jgi:hypothetical protein